MPDQDTITQLSSIVNELQKQTQSQQQLLAKQSQKIIDLERGSSKQVAVQQGTDTKTEYKLHILESSNYMIWKNHMENILDAKGLLQTVQGNGPVDEAREKSARALLTSALSNNNQTKVINCKTAKDIWQRLESSFENKTASEKQSLYMKFHSFKIRSVNEISDSISKIENLAARLNSLGEKTSDEHVIAVIIAALPKAFDTFKAVWKGTPEKERTLNNLISRINADIPEMLRKDLQEETALVAKHYKGQKRFRPRKFARTNEYGTNRFQKATNSDSAKGRAGGAGGQGFIQHDNSTDRGKQGKGGSGNRFYRRAAPAGNCFYCDKPGHQAKDCRKKQSDKGQTVAYMARVIDDGKIVAEGISRSSNDDEPLEGQRSVEALQVDRVIVNNNKAGPGLSTDLETINEADNTAGCCVITQHDLSTDRLVDEAKAELTVSNGTSDHGLVDEAPIGVAGHSEISPRDDNANRIVDETEPKLASAHVESRIDSREGESDHGMINEARGAAAFLASLRDKANPDRCELTHNSVPPNEPNDETIESRNLVPELFNPCNPMETCDIESPSSPKIGRNDLRRAQAMRASIDKVPLWIRDPVLDDPHSLNLAVRTTVESKEINSERD